MQKFKKFRVLWANPLDSSENIGGFIMVAFQHLSSNGGESGNYW